MGGLISEKKALPPAAPALPTTTVAGEWSKRTGLPKHLYSSSEEFAKKYGDPSKGVDKYKRTIYTKDGERILRFR